MLYMVRPPLSRRSPANRLDRSANHHYAGLRRGPIGIKPLSSGQALPRRSRTRGQGRGVRLRPSRPRRRFADGGRHRRTQAQLHPRSSASGRRPVRGLRRDLAGRARLASGPGARERPARAQALSPPRPRPARRLRLGQGRSSGRAGSVASAARCQAPLQDRRRTPPPARRSGGRRQQPPADHDRLSSAGTGLRGGAGAGAMSTARPQGQHPDAPKILLRNVFGWYVRVERGVYALSGDGAAALQCFKAHLAGAR